MNLNSIGKEELKQLLITRVLHYLGYSDRTEFEIRSKIKEYIEKLELPSDEKLGSNSFKEIDYIEVEDLVIARLYELSFIDDEKLARNFVSSKLKGSRPFGRRTISQLLKAKGVSSHLIEKVLNEIDPQIEEESIEKLFEKKHRSLKYSLDLTAKKKVTTYLLGRGCSPEVVYSLVDSKFKVK